MTLRRRFVRSTVNALAESSSPGCSVPMELDDLGLVLFGKYTPMEKAKIQRNQTLGMGTCKPSDYLRYHILT